MVIKVDHLGYVLSIVRPVIDGRMVRLKDNIAVNCEGHELLPRVTQLVSYVFIVVVVVTVVVFYHKISEEDFGDLEVANDRFTSVNPKEVVQVREIDIVRNKGLDKINFAGVLILGADEVYCEVEGGSREVKLNYDRSILVVGGYEKNLQDVVKKGVIEDKGLKAGIANLRRLVALVTA